MIEPFEESLQHLRNVSAPPGLAARVLAAAREKAETRFRRRTACLNGLACFGLSACAVMSGHGLLPAVLLAVTGLGLGVAAACAATD